MAPTTVERLDEALVLIREGLQKVTTLITPELAAHDFHAMGKKLTELNGLLNTRSVITTTIGFLADKHHSGDVVGSRTPETYVMNLLAVSRAEARRIIDLGKDTYAPPAFSEIRKELRSAHSAMGCERHASADDERKAEQLSAAPSPEQRKEEYQQARRIHEDQKKAQNLAAETLAHNTPGEEYLRILDSELRHLEGVMHRQSIRAAALQKTSELDPTEFRYHVRRLVKRSNGVHHDPHAGFRKRYIAIGKPDADGGARISGYLPAPTLALLQHALAAANRPDPDTGAQSSGGISCDPATGTTHSDVREPRKLGQRRVDTLATILNQRVRSAESRHGGVGSLVVSITTGELQEILNETNGARLVQLVHQPRPTNTASHISLAELMDLGLAKYDMACVHDSATGNALFLGRTKRSASFWQKVALVAEQLVCSHPGCDVPAVNCEVHHIVSWNNGGNTDIDNLTLLCRNHHMDNNDSKSLSIPRGWAETDPITCRKGHQPRALAEGGKLPPVRINTGLMAQQAAGYKIFTAHKHRETPRSNTSDQKTAHGHYQHHKHHERTSNSSGRPSPRRTPFTGSISGQSIDPRGKTPTTTATSTLRAANPLCTSGISHDPP